MTDRDTVAINTALLGKAVDAVTEIGDVPGAHARALLFAAAMSLRWNSAKIEATPAELAHKAQLTDQECAEAIEALDFIRVLITEGEGEEAPEGLFLHPDVAWFGDPAEQRRASNLYLSPVLL